jgi:hypothetical protein
MVDKKKIAKIRMVKYNCRQRTGIAAGVEFIVRPARNYCPIENIKLKLTTKSQIEIRLPEQKYSDAYSRSFNVQPHL